MKAADSGALTADSAGDMHEAGIVNCGADLGAGSENTAKFIGQHGGGDFHVLDGKRSAKAATFVGFRQIDQREAAHLFEKALGLIAEMEGTQGMAGGMQRYGVRKKSADIGDAEFIDKQLGEFENARQQLVDSAGDGGVGGGGRHLRIMIANHGNAGGGRDADGLVVAEDLEEVAHQRHRFGLVAGVVVHLAAAGLGLAEFDGMPQALEHSHDGSTGLREERVVVAGDEEGDVQGGLNTSLASAERSLGAAGMSARATCERCNRARTLNSFAWQFRSLALADLVRRGEIGPGACYRKDGYRPLRFGASTDGVSDPLAWRNASPFRGRLNRFQNFVVEMYGDMRH